MEVVDHLGCDVWQQHETLIKCEVHLQATDGISEGREVGVVDVDSDVENTVDNVEPEGIEEDKGKN